MICTTTTPFAFQDIALTLAKTASQVENAWNILQPYFGTQLTFGFGRIVPAPNFFDVVAMGVLIELTAKPCDVNDLLINSLCVAEEVAIYMDSEEALAILGKAQRAEVIEYLIAVFSSQTIEEQCQLVFQCKVGVVAVVTGIMEKVHGTLIDSRINEPFGRKERFGALDRISLTRCCNLKLFNT